MILGSSTPPAGWGPLATGVVALMRVPSPAEDVVVGSVVVRAKGTGASASQRIRALLHVGGVAYPTDEATVAGADAPAWIHMLLDTPVRVPSGADVRLGVWGGPGSGSTIAYAANGADTLYQEGVTYDQDPNPLAAQPQTFAIGVCAVAVGRWSAPAATTDEERARLPAGSASRALMADVAPQETYLGRAGWHGTSVDPETGSFAVARSDGPLAALVGERLLVTNRDGGASVAVYCHTEQDFDPDLADEDISLSRRAFAAVAPLAAPGADVVVQVLR